MHLRTRSSFRAGSSEPCARSPAGHFLLMPRVTIPETTPFIWHGTTSRRTAPCSSHGSTAMSWEPQTSPASAEVSKRRLLPVAEPYTSDEMMTVAAARRLPNGAVCFVGIGLPSAAANLARLTHAPDAVLIYESGPIGAKPAVLPLSIGDGELSETADAVVSIAEMFAYWLQGGRINVGFLGGAQIDRFANLNSTVIGPYDKPSVRLPGAG